MMATKHLRLLAMGLAVAGLAGCGDATTEPSADDEFVAVLESLAWEANQSGDADASSAYSAAALAFRLGIRPTVVDVAFDGVPTRYRAFVHVVTHARAGAEAIRLRTLVAVRGEGRPEAVLYVATVSDSTALVQPTMPLERRVDVRQLAWAAWRDLVADQIWVATSGKAGVPELAIGAGGPCPNVSGGATVQCTIAAFKALLEGVFHPLVGNPRGQLDFSEELGISLRASPVSGAILGFPGN